MKESKKKGIGFIFAWQGLKEVIKNEKNFQIHLLIAALAVILGLILHISQIEWLFLVLIIAGVLYAEMINSIIERLIDYVKPAYHPKAGAIKDIAAASVLLMAIVSLIIGSIIFLPKIYELFI